MQKKLLFNVVTFILINSVMYCSEGKRIHQRTDSIVEHLGSPHNTIDGVWRSSDKHDDKHDDEHDDETWKEYCENYCDEGCGIPFLLMFRTGCYVRQKAKLITRKMFFNCPSSKME